MNARAAAAVVMLAACGTDIDAEPVTPPGLVELTVHAARLDRVEGQIASSVADPQSLGIYEYTLRDAPRELARGRTADAHRLNLSAACCLAHRNGVGPQR